ncbi:hypothetical protein SAMN04487969_107160 [Paenibacillus algorifonticola]|uniref:Uncharacterized protein n=1 Tax=Paenibacillus algorifonticola TaxID=684063 RepID=A0A1I2DPZ7_9BACL|nr:hypothetical protein SAMN04487969_107160 [Paenibacillus algorifonticola]
MQSRHSLLADHMGQITGKNAKNVDIIGYYLIFTFLYRRRMISSFELEMVQYK